MNHFSSFLHQRMEQLFMSRSDLAISFSTKNKSKAYRHIDAWLSGKQLPNNQQVKMLAEILHVTEDEISNLVEAEKLNEASKKVYEEQKKQIAARNAFLPHIGVYCRITSHHLPLPYFTTDNQLQDRIPIEDDVLNLSLNQLLEVMKVKIDEYISINRNSDFISPNCFFKLNLEFDKRDGICVDRNATLISEPEPKSEFHNIKTDEDVNGLQRFVY